METMTKPIGAIIKQLMTEKRLSGQQVGNRLGMTRQGVYSVINQKIKMDIEDIERWASALETTSDEIIRRIKGEEVLDSKPKDGGLFGEEVAKRIMEELKLLREQLAVKDSQINKLLNMLDRQVVNFRNPATSKTNMIPSIMLRNTTGARVHA